MRLIGLVNEALTVLAVEPPGDDAVTVAYRRDNGTVDEYLLFRAELVADRPNGSTGSRPDLQPHLTVTDWDLVVVDEAHRMLARWWGGEITMTQRYRLGQTLSGATRHLLLMTASPHAGDEASFQLFMALLDPDRFEGQFRADVHSQDTSGLMRRMLKEDLLGPLAKEAELRAAFGASVTGTTRSCDVRSGRGGRRRSRRSGPA